MVLIWTQREGFCLQILIYNCIGNCRERFDIKRRLRKENLYTRPHLCI